MRNLGFRKHHHGFSKLQYLQQLQSASQVAAMPGFDYEPGPAETISKKESTYCDGCELYCPLSAPLCKTGQKKAKRAGSH